MPEFTCLTTVHQLKVQKPQNFQVGVRVGNGGALVKILLT